MTELCLATEFPVQKGALGSYWGRWGVMESGGRRTKDWRIKVGAALRIAGPAATDRREPPPLESSQLVSRAGPGPAGLAAGTGPGGVHTPANRKRERARPGAAGQLAGGESRAWALGAGEAPPAPPRFGVREVGRAPPSRGPQRPPP